MSIRRFAVAAALLLGVALFLGCGDSSPTVNTAPNDKQKQKDQPPGPGGVPQKK